PAEKARGQADRIADPVERLGRVEVRPPPVVDLAADAGASVALVPCPGGGLHVLLVRGQRPRSERAAGADRAAAAAGAAPGADAARAVPLRVAHAARAAGGAVALRVAHAATGADAGLDQPLELVRRGRGLRLDGGGIIEKVIEHRVHGSFRLR